MGIFCMGQGRWRVLDEADSHVGPAELDGGVRPPIHLQVHLLGLDHIPASREDAATGPQCGGLGFG